MFICHCKGRAAVVRSRCGDGTVTARWRRGDGAVTARRPLDGAAAAAYLSNYKAELESVKVWERVVSSLKSLAVYVVRCIVIEYYGPVVVAIMWGRSSRSSHCPLSLRVTAFILWFTKPSFSNRVELSFDHLSVCGLHTLVIMLYEVGMSVCVRRAAAAHFSNI